MKSKDGTPSRHESPHINENGEWVPDLDRYPFAPLRPGEVFVKVPPVLGGSPTPSRKVLATEKERRRDAFNAEKRKRERVTLKDGDLEIDI